jgi:cell division protein FtsB
MRYYTSVAFALLFGKATNTNTMATRQTTKTQTMQRAQRRGRRILAGVFFFVVCVLVVDALVGDQGLMATMRARKQYDELVADLVRLRTENSSLREEARRLSEDPAAIEEIARRELGLMSPGEKLFIIRDIDPPASK